MPKRDDPVDVALLNTVLQNLIEGEAAAQPSHLLITSDSIRVIDNADDDVINQLTLDYIVYCNTMGLAVCCRGADGS